MSSFHLSMDIGLLVKHVLKIWKTNNNIIHIQILLQQCINQFQKMFTSYFGLEVFSKDAGSLQQPFKALKVTFPKTNMEPKNEDLEDESPFQRGDFQAPVASFQGSYWRF